MILKYRNNFPTSIFLRLKVKNLDTEQIFTELCLAIFCRKQIQGSQEGVKKIAFNKK